MALPAYLLDRLPAQVRRGEPVGDESSSSTPPGLALGLSDLDALLPDGGVPRGCVTELAVAGGAALGTTIALATCRAAQTEALACGGEASWCAFVDPSGTLYGPGVSAAGVDRERLLVVRPGSESIERTVIRLAESQSFAVLVVDTLGVPGAPLNVSLGSWLRVVRRLALSAEGSGACILLMTDGEARRPLPLPVAMRLELGRESFDRVSVKIGKERRGRISGPSIVRWGLEKTESRPKTLSLDSALDSARKRAASA